MRSGFATAQAITRGDDITREELENAVCIALVRRGITDEGGRYTEANKLLVERIMEAAQAYADTAARDAVADHISRQTP